MRQPREHTAGSSTLRCGPGRRCRLLPAPGSVGSRRPRLHQVVQVHDAHHLATSVEHGERHRSEEHTSELQSLAYLVCRLLLEKKKKREKSTRVTLHVTHNRDN